MKASYATMEEAVLSADDRRNERPFRCHVHDDSQASASVNVLKGVWVCYGCHAKGRVDGEIIETDFVRSKDDIFALLSDDADHEFTESMLSLYTSGEINPYWRERFSEDAIEHFALGTDPVSGRPCYPLRDSAGKLLGMVMRNLDRQPKYKYPKGVKAHRLLWNYTTEHRRQVVLVEGAMDAIAAWEVGVEAFGIYGSNLGEAQVELLCKISPQWVHLAFDNDAAGQKCTEDARELLEAKGFYVDVFPWRSYPFHKDIADLAPQTRQNSLQHLLAP
jgi:DNA primase